MEVYSKTDHTIHILMSTVHYNLNDVHCIILVK